MTTAPLLRSLGIAALGVGAFVLSCAGTPPALKPGASILIPASAGKFDFLAVDPVTHRLLAGHEKDDTADFIDLDTHRLLARVKVGPAVGVIADPKTGNYFASVQDDKRIAVIDGRTFKETGSIALPGECDAILFDAKDRRIYIANDNGKYLWAVDPDAAKVVASIEIPGEPECMAHDEATGRIFLNLKNRNEVAVIDLGSATVTTTWPTAPATGPHGLVFDSAHGRIFSSGENGLLVSLDSQSGKVVATAPIVEHVDQIAFDPTTRRIFCAGPDALSVVQATDNGLTSLGQVATNPTAKNVAVDLKTHAVWTTFTDGKDSFAKSWTQD